jgi:SAM-dependent methyltransferase
MIRTMEARPAEGQREVWESRWRRHSGPEFEWHLSEPPPELVDLLQGSTIPGGAALDLGCGDGVATMYLSGSIRPAVGMDIAEAAARRAATRASEVGAPARFVVGAAPLMPFARGRFSLVFDRGCLQHLPRRSWDRYFSEVADLLVPGGVLQLYVSRGDPMWRGVRGAARALARKVRAATSRGRPLPSVGLLRRMLPRTMEPLEARRFPFRTKAGKRRLFVYVLARRR